MKQKNKVDIDKKIEESLIKNLDNQIILATKKVIKNLAKSLCGSLIMVSSWFLLSLNFPNLSPKAIEYIHAALIASTSISTFYAAQQLLSASKEAKKLCEFSYKKEKIIKEISLQNSEPIQHGSKVCNQQSFLEDNENEN